jgi:hypothetical protein
MTTTNLIALFDIMQDKYGSPNVDSTETLRFLNMAQYERLNRLIPDDKGGQINFELDQNVEYNLKPFLWTFSSTTTAGGVLTNSTINAALSAAVLAAGSTDTATTVHRLLSITVTDSGVTYPVKFVKYNNIAQYIRNYFKTPSVSNARYTITGVGLQFYPSTSALTVSLGVIKTPKEITLAVSPEWSEDNNYLILAIALQLAGISTRDEELISDIRNVKIAQ